MSNLSIAASERTHGAVLRSFWIETELRGIPRVVHSRAVVTRISWGIASIVCLTMLLYQTAILFISVRGV